METELTREVASGGPEREDRRSGQEVVEGLLLDRVDAVAARAAVGRQDDLIVLAHADEAHAALPLVKLAEARAHVALDAAVLDDVPVLGRNDGLFGTHGNTPLP